MNIHKLEKSTIYNYLHFTFPKYQQLLQKEYNENDFVAYGATDGCFPIGFIVAKIINNEAELLSIYVQDDYRNQKIGTRLYLGLEEELKKRGLQGIQLEYMKEKKASKYLERILSKTGFDAPRLNMTFYYFDYHSITKPRWVRELTLPEKYEIFSLVEMTDKDKEHYLEIISEEGFPNELKIMQDYPLTPQTSFGLRANGEFIGWMTTHFIQQDLLRYSCLYVTEKHLSKGASIGLITHTIREHFKVFQELKPRALFGVKADYDRMQQMVMRKFAPYASSIQQGMFAKKSFSVAS